MLTDESQGFAGVFSSQLSLISTLWQGGHRPLPHSGGGGSIQLSVVSCQFGAFSTQLRGFACGMALLSILVADVTDEDQFIMRYLFSRRIFVSCESSSFIDNCSYSPSDSVVLRLPGCRF